MKNTQKIRFGSSLLILGLFITILTASSSFSSGKAAFQGQLDAWIAFIGEDGNVWRVHSDGSELQQLTTDASQDIVYSELKWSSDGKILGMVKEVKNVSFPLIRLVSADTFEIQIEIPETNGQYDWSPDGAKIVYIASPSDPNFIDNGIWFYDLATNRREILVSPAELTTLCGELGNCDSTSEYYFRFPDWSPDGNIISFVQGTPGPIGDGAVYYFYSLLTGETFSLDINANSAKCDWSVYDSQFICVGNFNAVETNCAVRYLDSDGTQAVDVEISDTDCWISQFIATSEIADGVAIVPGFVGQEILILTANGVENSLTTGIPLDWSPDGTRLLVRNTNDIFVVDRETQSSYFLTKGSQAAWQPALSTPLPPEPSPTPTVVSTSTSVPTQSPTPDVPVPTPTQSHSSPEPEQPGHSEPSSFFQAPWFGPTVLLVGFVLFVVGLTGFWKYRN